jgi:hypothetical protein
MEKLFVNILSSLSADSRVVVKPGAQDRETEVSIPPTVSGAVTVNGAASLDAVTHNPDGSRPASRAGAVVLAGPPRAIRRGLAVVRHEVAIKGDCARVAALGNHWGVRAMPWH